MTRSTRHAHRPTATGPTMNINWSPVARREAQPPTQPGNQRAIVELPLPEVEPPDQPAGQPTSQRPSPGPHLDDPASGVAARRQPRPRVRCDRDDDALSGVRRVRESSAVVATAPAPGRPRSPPTHRSTTSRPVSAFGHRPTAVPVATRPTPSAEAAGGQRRHPRPPPAGNVSAFGHLREPCRRSHVCAQLCAGGAQRLERVARGREPVTMTLIPLTPPSSGG